MPPWATWLMELWRRRASTVSRERLFVGAFEPRAYTSAVVVLAAKLAKCDGPVNRLEIRAFKHGFRLRTTESRQVAALFDQARESPEGFQPFALQLAQMLGRGSPESREVLALLHTVAVADGPVQPLELAYLRRVAEIMGVGPDLDALLAAYRAPEPGDAYGLLGVSPQASDQEVRRAWHRLTRRFHPDRAAARGEQAADHARMAEINAAYRRIMAERRPPRRCG